MYIINDMMRFLTSPLQFLLKFSFKQKQCQWDNEVFTFLYWDTDAYTTSRSPVHFDWNERCIKLQIHTMPQREYSLVLMRWQILSFCETHHCLNKFLIYVTTGLRILARNQTRLFILAKIYKTITRGKKYKWNRKIDNPIWCEGSEKSKSFEM